MRLRTPLLMVLLLTPAALAEAQAVTSDQAVTARSSEVVSQAADSAAMVSDVRRTLQQMFDTRQSGQTGPPRVAITVHVYDADGNTSAMAINNRSGAFTLYVYARRSLCELSAGSEELPADAGYGWRVSVQPLGGSPAGVTGSNDRSGTRVFYVATDVQVDWQRMWESGKPVNRPATASRLTLRPGDRVPLDLIAAPAMPNGCAGTRMTLYIGPAVESGAGGAARTGGGGGGAVSPSSGSGAGSGSGGGRSAGTGAAAGGRGVGASAGGVGGGGTMGGSFGGGGSARAGGGSAGTGSAGGVVTGAGTISIRPGSGFGYNVRSFASAEACAAEPAVGPTTFRFVDRSGICADLTIQTVDPAIEIRPVPLELWLVHGRPGGTEGVQYEKVQTADPAGRFSFAPEAIETASGNLTIEIFGVVQARREADGTESLGFAVVHEVRTPDGKRSVGSGSRTIALPKAGEVVSVEFPPGPREPEGHTFSVRVRTAR